MQKFTQKFPGNELRQVIMQKMYSDERFIYNTDMGLDFFTATDIDLKKMMFGLDCIRKFIVHVRPTYSSNKEIGFVNIFINATNGIKIEPVFNGWIENEADFDRLLVMMGINL